MQDYGNCFLIEQIINKQKALYSFITNTLGMHTRWTVVLRTTSTV